METNQFSQQNNNSTVAMPPMDLLKIEILKFRSHVLYHLRDYIMREQRTGATPSSHGFNSSVRMLYYCLEPSLQRWMDKIEFDKLHKNVESIKFNDNLQAFRCISAYLDKKRITRIDLEKEYDATSVEAENLAKSM